MEPEPPRQPRLLPSNRVNLPPDRRPIEKPASPANDAAARKALEREIRAALGDRARSVEVRVTGRNALVVIKPTRFWQKRAIRTTVENLPGLVAYRTRIDVLD